jgi:aryl-alcohol dehydrogenase-like predicted oxidoreductase
MLLGLVRVWQLRYPRCMNDTMTANAKSSGTVTFGEDLTVNRMGFGAMRITGQGVWGPPADKDGAIELLRHVIETGINFIDTADSYGPYVSEELIAEALHPYPKDLVIGTKGGLVRTGPNGWLPVGRPEYLHQEVEMSLRRLKLECIDLWQLHRIDSKVPVEESLGVIKKLQQAGKIRHVGLSEVKPAEIDRARKVIEIVSVQNRYNVGDREHEDTLDYCAKHGIVFIPWFPVAAGDLARPGGKLDALAKKHGATVSQLSLAWLLQHSPVIAPIPGTTSIAHLDENVASSNVKLDPAEWEAIEAEAATIR